MLHVPLQDPALKLPPFSGRRMTIEKTNTSDHHCMFHTLWRCHLVSLLIKGRKSMQLSNISALQQVRLELFITVSTRIQEARFLTPKVRDLLQQTYSFLRPHISYSIANQPTYQAFFREVDPRSVREVFARIAAGSNITFKDSPSPSHPQIFCMSPNRRDDIAVCSKRRVFYHNNAVGPCPKFFGWLLHAENCGCTNTAKIEIVSKVVDDHQYRALIMGQAYMYLEQILRNLAIKLFILNFNECTEAPSRQKVGNIL